MNTGMKYSASTGATCCIDLWWLLLVYNASVRVTLTISKICFLYLIYISHLVASGAPLEQISSRADYHWFSFVKIWTTIVSLILSTNKKYLSLLFYRPLFLFTLSIRSAMAWWEESQSTWLSLFAGNSLKFVVQIQSVDKRTKPMS